jgi:putative inorganic carbon (HCO3(-)) transporter
MPFNYYDIVTALTIGVLALAALFLITQRARLLWILAVACIPFSAEIIVELPIQATNLPSLFFPTDFLAGIITVFIFLALPLLKGQNGGSLGLRNSKIFTFWVLYISGMFVSTLLSVHFIVSAKFFVMQFAYMLAYGGLGYYLMQRGTIEIDSVYKRYLIGALVATFFVCVIEHIILGSNRDTVDQAISPFFREHTVYGAFTAWMFVVYFILWRNSRASIGLLVALLFSGAALFLSYSRGGWLSAMGALVIVLVAQWLWRLPRGRALAALAGSGLLAIGGLSFLLSSQGQMWLNDKLSNILGDTGKRIASSFDTQRDLSNVGRIHRWIVAWELFKQSPLTGIGPNTYAEEYHAYKRASQLLGVIKKVDLAYAGIHSEYITALTEMGIVGILLLVALYGMTLYYPLAYAFSAGDKQTRLIGLLVSVPLLSYYLHAFINNFMDHGKMAALIYLHWGAAMALEVQMRKQKQSIQKYGMASQEVV